MNQEEGIIRDYLGSFRGRLLDLGASDGMTGSNTRYFVDSGWQAVLVEASYKYMTQLMNLYHDDPNVEIVHGLVTPREAGLVRFYDCDDPALSTISEDLKARGFGRETARKMWIPSFSVGQLYDKFGDFHYVNIDLEGLSIAILKSVHWLKMDCRVLCVEAFKEYVFGKDEAPEIIDVGKSAGYKFLARTNENVILVR